MIKINNKEEMQKYYIKEINMYSFNDDVDFKCNIVVDSGIFANDIKALNIKVHDINACDIKARNIKAHDINAFNIKAWDIKAWDIKSWDIKAWNIEAWNIKAWNIKANNISFNAVCFAYEYFKCNSIKGTRKNSRYFCLDSDVIIKSKNI